MGVYTMNDIKIIFFDIDGTLIEIKKKTNFKKSIRNISET